MMPSDVLCCDVMCVEYCTVLVLVGEMSWALPQTESLRTNVSAAWVQMITGAAARRVSPRRHEMFGWTALHCRSLHAMNWIEQAAATASVAVAERVDTTWLKYSSVPRDAEWDGRTQWVRLRSKSRIPPRKMWTERADQKYVVSRLETETETRRYATSGSGLIWSALYLCCWSPNNTLLYKPKSAVQISNLQYCTVQYSAVLYCRVDSISVLSWSCLRWWPLLLTRTHYRTLLETGLPMPSWSISIRQTGNKQT